MLVSMFPNLNALANICLAIPLSIASVESSFSQNLYEDDQNTAKESNWPISLDENCYRVSGETI